MPFGPQRFSVSLRRSWLLCRFMLHHTGLELSSVYPCNFLSFASDYFTCMWKRCNAVFQQCLMLRQHVCFHGYHTRLMNIGKNVLQRTNLPQCVQPYSIDIPEHPHGYTCDWQDCGYTFTTVFGYYEHMRMHVSSNPTYIKNTKKQQLIKCLWKGLFSTIFCVCDLYLHERIWCKVAPASSTASTSWGITCGRTQRSGRLPVLLAGPCLPRRPSCMITGSDNCQSKVSYHDYLNST